MNMDDAKIDNNADAAACLIAIQLLRGIDRFARSTDHAAHSTDPRIAHD